MRSNPPRALIKRRRSTNVQYKIKNSLICVIRWSLLGDYSCLRESAQPRLKSRELRTMMAKANLSRTLVVVTVVVGAVAVALFGVGLERFSYRVCPWHRIPAMREVAACVLGTDRQKRLFGGLKQRLKRPGLGLPQQGLNLREGLLYGVEVGGVGRQQPQLAALLLDQFPDPFALVHGEVVHEDDLPGLEGRSQDLPHVDAEGVGVR